MVGILTEMKNIYQQIRERSSKIYVTYVILFQGKSIPMQFHVKEHNEFVCF